MFRKTIKCSFVLRGMLWNSNMRIIHLKFWTSESEIIYKCFQSFSLGGRCKSNQRCLGRGNNRTSQTELRDLRRGGRKHKVGLALFLINNEICSVLWSKSLLLMLIIFNQFNNFLRLSNLRSFQEEPWTFLSHFRKAQKELKDQIAGLEDQFRLIEDEQTCPVDLESYINKLNSAKKRIIVVNNVLQGAQVTRVVLKWHRVFHDFKHSKNEGEGVYNKPPFNDFSARLVRFYLTLFQTPISYFWGPPIVSLLVFRERFHNIPIIVSTFNKMS